MRWWIPLLFIPVLVRAGPPVLDFPPVKVQLEAPGVENGRNFLDDATISDRCRQ